MFLLNSNNWMGEGAEGRHQRQPACFYRGSRYRDEGDVRADKQDVAPAYSSDSTDLQPGREAGSEEGRKHYPGGFGC